MNKQEYQQKIKNMKRPKFFNAITLDEAYEAGFEKAKNNALFESCFLDEPEKPVVPQFVADWYEDYKGDLEFNIYNLCIEYRDNGQGVNKDLKEWFGNDSRTKPIETLMKMKFFGYEVEKEKLYTVKFANEDFGKIYIGIFKKFNKLGISSLPLNDDEVKSWFTEDELKRFKFWDNPAFEIEEVKE